MIHVFKLVCDPEEGGFDKSLPLLFQMPTRSHKGHDKKLFYNRFNRDIRKYSFTIRTVKAWNSLPNYVVDSDSILNFEKNLDSHWKSQEMYFDDYAAELSFE